MNFNGWLSVLSVWAALWFSIAEVIALGNPQVADPNKNEATLRTQVSAQVTEVASPIEYTIEVLAPQGLEPVFPLVSSPWGEWEILDLQDRFDVPVENEPSQRSWRRTLRLEAWKSGQLTIPALTISFGDEAEAPLVSDLIEIEVRSTLSENASLDQASDIRPVIDSVLPKRTQATWLWPVGVAVGLGLILFSIVLFWKRPSRVLSTSQRFREALQGLQQRSTTNESPRAIVEDLVGAIREFFPSGLSVRDRALTDDEFLNELGSRGLSTETQCSLQQIFELKEKAQFAGRPLILNEVRECLRMAYDVLEQRLRDQATQPSNPSQLRDSSQTPRSLDLVKLPGESHGV